MQANLKPLLEYRKSCESGDVLGGFRVQTRAGR